MSPPEEPTRLVGVLTIFDPTGKEAACYILDGVNPEHIYLGLRELATDVRAVKSGIVRPTKRIPSATLAKATAWNAEGEAKAKERKRLGLLAGCGVAAVLLVAWLTWPDGGDIRPIKADRQKAGLHAPGQPIRVQPIRGQPQQATADPKVIKLRK